MAERGIMFGKQSYKFCQFSPYDGKQHLCIFPMPLDLASTGHAPSFFVLFPREMLHTYVSSRNHCCHNLILLPALLEM